MSRPNIRQVRNSIIGVRVAPLGRERHERVTRDKSLLNMRL